MKPTTCRTYRVFLVSALAGLCMVVAGHTATFAQAVATQAFVKQLNYARAGVLESQLFVAKAFVEGTLVERNIQQAVGWYMLAAKRGSIEAQFQAAKILHAGGNGVKRQPVAATKLYKAAAKRGHPGAQNWLGFAYQHGQGVIKDYTTAASWYKNAADQGLPEAENNLGLLYLTGSGVERDHVKAAKLFQTAADQGYGFAMNNLAGMYEVGWGVERDAGKARELFLNAALTGNTSAIENLKRLGEPVPYEAEQQAALNASKSLQAVKEPTEDQTSEEDVLARDGQFYDVPTFDSSDQEFEQWLAAQEDEVDDPTTQTDDNDSFGFLRKNWNRLNRRRSLRTDPSDTLR